MLFPYKCVIIDLRWFLHLIRKRKELSSAKTNVHFRRCLERKYIMQQQQFEQLRTEFRLEITEDTEFYWNGEVKKLPTLGSIIKTFENERVYATGSRVIAFIYKGRMFVTYDTKEAIDALRNANYRGRAFFVPLSPKDMSFKDAGLAARWQELKALTNPIRRTAQDMRERRAELAQHSHLSAQPAVATA